MKILYLSPVHPLLTSGKPLPYWQTQSSHIRALTKLGHQVKVFCYTPPDHIQLSPVERLVFNLKLISLAQRCKKIDVILLSFGADVFFPVTVNIAKRLLNAKLIVLSGVSPIWDGNPRERGLAKFIDVVAVNDEVHARQWQRLGVKKAVVLPISAIDPLLHRERRARVPGNRDIDVLFLGTLTKQRKVFLDKLQQLLPKTVKIVINEYVWEEEYAKLLSQAKIVINPLRREMAGGANLRLFEIPAFGAMQLASHTRDEWFKDGKEIVVYKDVQDAANKIMFYLNYSSQRLAIAKAGHRRVMKAHTFERRFGKIFVILRQSSRASVANREI